MNAILSTEYRVPSALASGWTLSGKTLGFLRSTSPTRPLPKHLIQGQKNLEHNENYDIPFDA